MGDDMDMGMSTDMDTSEHHHETHFRGMDAPGDDSGTKYLIVNFTFNHCFSVS